MRKPCKLILAALVLHILCRYVFKIIGGCFACIDVILHYAQFFFGGLIVVKIANNHKLHGKNVAHQHGYTAQLLIFFGDGCKLAYFKSLKFQKALRHVILTFFHGMNVIGTKKIFRLHFFGRCAHVASQHKGVDAIMMAVRAYTSLEMMIAKEIDGRESVVFNIGAIHGGVTNNIVSDSCELFGTLRTHTAATDEMIIGRIKAICEATALSAGGSFTFEEVKYYPVVYNDPTVTARLREAAVQTLGENQVLPKKSRSMGGEDFSYMTQQKPGAMLRLGIRNAACGITAGIHESNFDIDEHALGVGVDLFVQFVLDNMQGIAGLPAVGHTV